ncbi:threonine/serine exporter family protein [Nocardioides panacis]|uniref:Threonine/serine exporter family protein n=1 Tax=Nocardioides panacis TaxID=2849501 RepID=A0A975Y1A4_9ACTN|nr:threonine/serine exporter family protein [Nocardioides panacis]QWZ09307.1 threonine/serine exporter family protein [Nocardioides panacis]
MADSRDTVRDTGRDPARDQSRDVYKTLDLGLRIGEVLLSSGAGAADVGATMLNVAHGCGLRGATADVTFTELAMSHQTSFDEPSMIQIRQVRHREIDYEDLTLVDHLVRDLVRGEIDRDEARSRLARIVSSGHRLPRWAVTLSLGVMGAGVGLLVGGDWVVTLIAFVAAVGVDLLQRQMSRRRLPGFYQQVAGGLLATLIAVTTVAVGVDVDPSRVVTAGIILLLAGINFMGAIQDALTGFPLTAGARILEAILATAGVIAGVSGGLTVGRMLGVNLGRLDPGITSFSDLPVMTLGAAITAAAFAFAAYAPLRSLAPIALIAGVAEVVFYTTFDRGLGVAWSSAMASVTVGLVSYAVAARVRVPPLVIVVSSIVPLLPGLSIYRGLYLLSEGGNGLLSMINAAAIAIALAAGVIFGEYVAQPLKREARRLEGRLSGPRLVGPMRARSVRRRTAARTDPR